jgi:hypothetical protein
MSLIPTKATELFKVYVRKNGTVEVYVTDWCKRNLTTSTAGDLIYAVTKVFATLLGPEEPQLPATLVANAQAHTASTMATITDHHPVLGRKDKKYFMDGEEVTQEIFRYQMEIAEMAKQRANDSQADGYKNGH